MEEPLLEVSVPGNPKSKERPRMTRYGRAYTPKATLDAERSFRDAVMAVYQGEPLGVDLAIEITFHQKDRRRRDVDNMAKMCLDSLNHKLFVDDSQVVDLHLRLYRASPEPRTEMVVRLSSL